MSHSNIHALFNPHHVAIIGASNTPGKIGHSIIKNMTDAGFAGTIYPVNPKSESILGIKVEPAIKNLPDNLDLAVIAIPRHRVVESLKELAAKGTRATVVITAGFKEVGGRGYHMEQEMVEIAHKNNMALLGPNCLGMINTQGKTNASFAAEQPTAGNIAFFSQSGALCVAILDWALGENIGFSKFISLGNKAVLDEADMLEYLARDKNTDVILGYIENVCEGQRFIQAATRVTQEKPVIMIKSGTTSAGAKAASSHTGAIAGSDQAYSSAFTKSGIIRAHDVQTLFNLAHAFSSQPLPKGPNLCVITNSGGPGIMAADACENSSMHIARLSPRTLKELQEFLPSYASLYNPVDIIGDAGAERYNFTLKTIIKDPNVNSILVILTPTSSAADEIETISRNLVQVAKNSDKPVSACFMGKKRVEIGKKILLEGGVPCYSFPEPAISSMEAMHDQYQRKIQPQPEQPEIKRDIKAARKVIDKARQDGRQDIVEFQALEILKAYNLPAPETRLARSSTDAIEAAEAIGYPVVLKIASPSISHKTDVKGVQVNLKNKKEVQSAFTNITSRALRRMPEAHIAGCLVQKMAPENCKEVIIGVKRDDQFGPLLMFGLGGVYVEVLKDISFRLAPLTGRDARDMLKEIKSYLLLKGFRGEKGVKLSALEEILMKMSQLAIDFPEIYEAEFNPVLVNSEQGIVADVRLTLAPEEK
ncbi:MAG: acetate--CoA ligase alpha subunit [Thermodesulfobacteriota bacterium]